MSSRTIRIGLCGLGTVGQGVWKHFSASRSRLEAQLGVKLELHRAAVRDLRRQRAVQIPAGKLTDDALAVATDPKVDIVCELIGGTGLARKVTLAALARGKVVVSANKALLCAHGAEIFAAARRSGGHFFFEASVAGGIPIIKALREGLVANRFRLIYGILNGTCNYILTRMSLEGSPYAEILADAKRLGYAEADESLDVEGTTVKATYRRVYSADCSLYKDSGACADKIKQATGLGTPDAALPDCTAAYDEEKKRMPDYAKEIDEMPSVITYEAELDFDGTTLTIKPLKGETS